MNDVGPITVHYFECVISNITGTSKGNATSVYSSNITSRRGTTLLLYAIVTLLERRG